MHSIANTEPYKTIVSGDYATITRLRIGNLIFNEDRIISVSTRRSAFDGMTPTVGCCVSGELDCTIIAESSDIPPMAQIIPEVKVVSVEKDLESAWIKKGVYFADTRTLNPKQGTVAIHAYDKILAMESAFSMAQDSHFSDVVNAIANSIGIALESNTASYFSALRSSQAYFVTKPIAVVSKREIMKAIAAACVGNWIVTDDGQLMLLRLNTLPAETFLLTDTNGNRITYNSQIGEGGVGVELR